MAPHRTQGSENNTFIYLRVVLKEKSPIRHFDKLKRRVSSFNHFELIKYGLQLPAKQLRQQLMS
jgi:hypothetical protein